MFTLPDQNFDCGISKSSALYFPCDVIIDIWNVCILHMCWFNQTSKQRFPPIFQLYQSNQTCLE